MKGYICYFKTMLITNLQYKTAAIAGICTQFFWGFLRIFIYQAFYEGSGQNVPIDFGNLVTYVWLQQALFALIYIRHRSNDVTKSIKNGTVAYELVRPYNLYVWWYIKGIAKKLAMVSLRMLPVIIFAFLLPEPYCLSMPASFSAFLMFMLNLILGALLLVAITSLMQILVFFTYDDTGIYNIFYTIAELLSGLTLPVPLLPGVLQKISYYLPFRLIGDLPFRVYSGDIPLNESIIDLKFQVLWLVILIVFGMILMKKATKKVCIQGG